MATTMINPNGNIDNRPLFERTMTIWLLTGLAIIALFLIGTGISTQSERTRVMLPATVTGAEAVQTDINRLLYPVPKSDVKVDPSPVK